MTTTDSDIDIKKVILSSLQNSDHPLTNIIEEILNSFNLLYDLSPSKNLMETAAQYIIAYLDMGFSYLEHKSLFDSTLQKAGFSPLDIDKMQHQNSIVILNKSQLRLIIGRWPISSNNSHTISAAINDIIKHVENNELGTYKYYTAKKAGSYTALYLLTVSLNYALFHDVLNNKFYQLVKK